MRAVIAIILTGRRGREGPRWPRRLPL